MPPPPLCPAGAGRVAGSARPRAAGPQGAGVPPHSPAELGPLPACAELAPPRKRGPSSTAPAGPLPSTAGGGAPPQHQQARPPSPPPPPCGRKRPPPFYYLCCRCSGPLCGRWTALRPPTDRLSSRSAGRPYGRRWTALRLLL